MVSTRSGHENERGAHAGYLRPQLDTGCGGNPMIDVLSRLKA
jgi:hypothetical protein